MIKFSKICLHQNSNFENFDNPRNFVIKSTVFFVPLFFIVYKENMFTIEIEVGREAPLKPSIYGRWDKAWPFFTKPTSLATLFYLLCKYMNILYWVYSIYYRGSGKVPVRPINISFYIHKFTTLFSEKFSLQKNVEIAAFQHEFRAWRLKF